MAEEKLNKEHVAKLLEAGADYQKQLQTITNRHQAYAELKHKLSQELATEKYQLEYLQKKRKEVKSSVTIVNLIETLQQDLSVLDAIAKSESVINSLTVRQSRMANSWAELSEVVLRNPTGAEMKRARLPLIPFFNYALNHLKAGDKLWRLVEDETLLYIHSETAHSVVFDGKEIVIVYTNKGELVSITSRPLVELFDEDGSHCQFFIWPQLSSAVMDFATQREILKTMNTSVTSVFVDT